jgi:hypothetical protein
MAGLMTAPMIVIELSLMAGMYPIPPYARGERLSASRYSGGER